MFQSGLVGFHEYDLIGTPTLLTRPENRMPSVKIVWDWLVSKSVGGLWSFLKLAPLLPRVKRIILGIVKTS